LFSVEAVDRAGNVLSDAFEFTMPNIPLPVVPSSLSFERGLFGLSEAVIGPYAFLALIVIILEVLIFFFRYGWHKFSRHLHGVAARRGDNSRKTNEDYAVPALNRLRSEVASQITLLEKISRKRPLTKEEEKMLNRLKGVLGPGQL
jgi:hypothetical protein